jgi:hypothetical protein
MTDLVKLEETREAHDELPDIIWRTTLQRLIVVAAAGFLAGRVPQDRKAVALVTGGNVVPAAVQRLLASRA